MLKLPPADCIIVPVVYKRRRSTLKRGKTAPKKKSKEKTTQKLTKELDAVVSRFVRLQAADHEGIVQCFTCPQKTTIKKIQCGHYVSRFYKATRWDLRNLRPQCFWCNIWKRGDPVTFRERLVKELGEAVVTEMEAARSYSYKLDKVWLQSEIDRYSLLLKEKVSNGNEVSHT